MNGNTERLAQQNEEQEDLSEEEELMIQEMCNLWVINNSVKIDEYNTDADNIKWELYLLGRIMTDKYVNYQGFLSYLQQKWRPKHGLEMRKTDHVIYIFQFNHQMDIQEGPWWHPMVFQSKHAPANNMETGS